jgi:hypothetical protein
MEKAVGDKTRVGRSPKTWRVLSIMLVLLLLAFALVSVGWGFG